MKKALSILLALIMLFTMSVTVFAEENTNLTFNNAADRIFNGYKLLNLSTSLKTGAHHTTHDGDHTDECYNFAYTVNEKYRAILQAETHNNGRNELWGEGGKPATAAGITDIQILDYLTGQTSNYGTMRQVADRIYRAILTESIAADANSLSGNATNNITQGYWLFADVTDLSGYDTNSLVMVDTKRLDALTISPKTALPTIDKKVKDIEDSEDSNILDNPWLDTADHDIGDIVPFKLTATLPSNAPYYTSYKMIFHDTLSAGLTLKTDSFKVLMYETEHKATVDTDLNDGTVVTAYFTVKTTGLTDTCTFEVSCDNLYAITGVTKDSTFVVYYEATLNADAVTGNAGNTNKVFLEFSNDPYDATSTGTTASDSVTVYTYQIKVNKIDNHGHALDGAGFTLYKKSLGGTYTAIGTELKGAGMTSFIWKGLDDGDYKLEETTVPDGYNKMNDIFFSISAEHGEPTPGTAALTSLDGGLMGVGVVESGIIDKDIVNNTGTVLPETGSQGTMLMICGGALLIVLAAVFMITRKKMSIYED
ncbi:MAG: isopeptide-forming domain-containing fimbrial protein [Clostridia bacterium]|nr:isopeptide-forming domain-containing fimbrial protein [Clostridia bacterium]